MSSVPWDALGTHCMQSLCEFQDRHMYIYAQVFTGPRACHLYHGAPLLGQSSQPPVHSTSPQLAVKPT